MVISNATISKQAWTTFINKTSKDNHENKKQNYCRKVVWVPHSGFHAGRASDRKEKGQKRIYEIHC